MNKPFGVAIVGGSGYGAGELLRILSMHPQIEIAQILSRSHVDKPVSVVHTNLEGISSLRFSESLRDNWSSSYEKSALICAMPTGLAVPTINDLIIRGLPPSVRIIDLSGDLRLNTPEIHNKFYPEVAYSTEIRSQCVYGLPEINRGNISLGRFITNPGCLATAAILALAPMKDAELSGPIVVDAKTGTSGAGREPQATMHHPGRSTDFTAYKVLEHRHEPEILQALGHQFSSRNSMMFIPHLIPVSRGIFVTCYMTHQSEACAAIALDSYRNFYMGSHFIRFRSKPPRLVDVIGTNFCDLHISVRGKQVAVMATLDNLVKGMAGQCVQNLNLLFGSREETGLLLPAIGPV